ncbi:uncharacterized protein B0P05DRAFT_195369 [Gilbertella persicaria]|nr:uncharacterized protein B0P05DRAFT_195369 [Gilbertella persicaria]KAI8069109.1 hypothetical protein B0P05DRAFT_195369 [Gilbertella persicaria]
MSTTKQTRPTKDSVFDRLARENTISFSNKHELIIEDNREAISEKVARLEKASLPYRPLNKKEATKRTKEPIKSKPEDKTNHRVMTQARSSFALQKIRHSIQEEQPVVDQEERLTREMTRHFFNELTHKTATDNQTQQPSLKHKEASQVQATISLKQSDQPPTPQEPSILSKASKAPQEQPSTISKPPVPVLKKTKDQAVLPSKKPQDQSINKSNNIDMQKEKSTQKPLLEKKIFRQKRLSEIMFFTDDRIKRARLVLAASKEKSKLFTMESNPVQPLLLQRQPSNKSVAKLKKSTSTSVPYLPFTPTIPKSPAIRK